MQTWSQLRVTAAKLQDDNRGLARYDAVIVDEAQDLEPAALTFLVCLVKDLGNLFVTADANQSIYGSSFTWSETHRRLEGAGEIGELSANFRSTREIATAAHSYLQTAMIDPELVEQTFVHEGPNPAMRQIRTDNEEADLLARFLRGASKELRLTLGSCAVLCPSGKAGKSLADALQRRSIPATYMLGRELDIYTEGVKILPLKSAKGLEFPVVAVAGLGAPYPFLPGGASNHQREVRLLLERRTLYVGMTRAMRALLVVAPESNRSGLLEGFDQQFWNVG